MEHLKTSFYFKGREGEWRVDFNQAQNGDCFDRPVDIFLNDVKEYHWDHPPNTRTYNVTKTKAKQIITASKKLKNKRYHLNNETSRQHT
jgi:hypothetical protein